jgi:hypothetical protein
MTTPLAVLAIHRQCIPNLSTTRTQQLPSTVNRMCCCCKSLAQQQLAALMARALLLTRRQIQLQLNAGSDTPAAMTPTAVTPHQLLIPAELGGGQAALKLPQLLHRKKVTYSHRVCDFVQEHQVIRQLCHGLLYNSLS